MYKFTVAVLLTPLIYAGHSAAERFLGREAAHELAAEAARQSGSAGSAESAGHAGTAGTAGTAG